MNTYKKFLYLFPLLLVYSTVVSQNNEVASKYASVITEEGLRDKLSIIASDALEGRMTGSRGQKMAAAFIEHHFREIGLKGPVDGAFRQTVPLTQITPNETYVQAGEDRFMNFKDFFFPNYLNTDGVQSIPIIYAGNGSDEEINQFDVKNKGVVIRLPDLTMETVFSSGKFIRKLKEKGALIILFAPECNDIEFDQTNSAMMDWFGRGAIVLENNIPAGLHAIFMRPFMTEKILKTSYGKLKELTEKNQLKKIKESRINWLSSYSKKPITSENVLGYLEGTEKKDELLIITAHFDHIGTNPQGSDKVNNGADDDGSGTTAVMQLAEAFAEAKRQGNGPKRSILFMTVTAEEEGLYGSEWYVTHPVFPLDQTMVNLNIDMIGRTDPGHINNKNYVYAIGSDKLSSDLHQLHEETNTKFTKLNIDYTYNDQDHPEQLYYRSDHWNFAKNNIPIIFYFDGIHEDYHKASDEVDKIEFEILKKRTELVFYTAWALANRENKLKINSGGK